MTPPQVVARLDERPRIVVQPDGSLLGLSVVAADGGWQLAARRSPDGGVTWSDGETQLRLPAGTGGWGGGQPLVTADGEVHVFLVNDAGTGVFPPPGGEREPRPAAERRIDVWHSRTDGGSTWREPVRIWQGYTGSINSAIQTRSGRIVLPFARLTSRTWRDRGDGLDAFTFAGTSETIVLVSDDGESFRDTGTVLKVPTPNIGTYGAIEPVVIERADGRLWMLIRTQKGRFYESLSDDGIDWTPAAPSSLVSSDSPAGLVRLTDGRLVLLWNKCLRYPYAYGGRHVLHGALSADDGRTWVGHREVARDPRRDEPPPPGGDHGTAYPFPVALPDDRVLVTTGQGEGRVVIVKLDPAWLEETTQRAHLSPEGLDEWSTFGCRGVELADGALRIERVDPTWPATAVWNHPLGRRGRLSLRLRLHAGSAGARLLLTDHYSVPFDAEDVLHSLYAVRLDAGGPPVDGGVDGEVIVSSTEGSWYPIELSWDDDAGRARLRIGDGAPIDVPRRHAGDGVCYLRLRPAADRPGPGFEVCDIDVAVTPPATRERA